MTIERVRRVRPEEIEMWCACPVPADAEGEREWVAEHHADDTHLHAFVEHGMS